MKQDRHEAIHKALLKKAVGYKVKENSLEYIIDEEGYRKPIKEKVQTKYYPPDISALKTYLEIKHAEDSLDDLTDEELEAEKQRLLAELERSG